MNTPTRTHRPGLTLRTPEDVLAKVPYLVGFHPHESLVVLAIRPDQEVHCTLRADLPPDVRWPEPERRDDVSDAAVPDLVDLDVAYPGVDRGVHPGTETDVEQGTQAGVDPGTEAGTETGIGRRIDESEILDLAVHLADVLFGQETTHALLIAYTSNSFRAGPVLRVVHAVLEAAGITVLDRLIADGQRWWSDACLDAGCCPRSGTPYDLAHHPVTARSVFAGEVALADEEALRRSIAPTDGGSASVMGVLIARVGEEVAGRSSACATGDAVRTMDQRMDNACHYVATLVETGAGVSSPLTDEQVARACVLVADHQAMAAVAKLVTPETAGVHQDLWTRVLRRTVAPHDAGPATLLAFAAWSGGHGALSRCALERALASDPDCPMAYFVAELLTHGVSPGLERA
ncbi:DUF4192 domain-containing protein [Actinopolymorpha sp. B11F2]|uniref:DUF4192 domain-containing protein n=1 Tax=Actinopolymorpha sp. B11F2 TaxID=3160862 RepID=UPI0032E3D240